jgi:hypothetical protein
VDFAFSSFFCHHKTFNFADESCFVVQRIEVWRMDFGKEFSGWFEDFWFFFYYHKTIKFAYDWLVFVERIEVWKRDFGFGLEYSGRF